MAFSMKPWGGGGGGGGGTMKKGLNIFITNMLAAREDFINLCSIPSGGNKNDR